MNILIREKRIFLSTDRLWHLRKLEKINQGKKTKQSLTDTTEQGQSKENNKILFTTQTHWNLKQKINKQKNADTKTKPKQNCSGIEVPEFHALKRSAASLRIVITKLATVSECKHAIKPLYPVKNWYIYSVCCFWLLWRSSNDFHLLLESLFSASKKERLIFLFYFFLVKLTCICSHKTFRFC